MKQCESMRLLALLLTVSLTGPPVASLLCDWVCAAKHQVAASATGCHEHATRASTPTLARGHQCHDVTTPPESVLISISEVPGVLAIADQSSLTNDQPGQLDDRSGFHVHSPAHSPPPLVTPLRI